MALFEFDSHVLEGGEAILPESYGAENAQFGYHPGWDSLDPNLEAMRYYQHHYGFNLEKNTYPHFRYFSSYDGAAHGFGLDTAIKQTETQLYHLGIDTHWHGEHGYARHARYLSPVSLGGSLSSSNASMSDFPLSPDASNATPSFSSPHGIYPSPISESYEEQTDPMYQPLSNEVFSVQTSILPSQSAYSMRDLQLSPDTHIEDTFVEDSDTIKVNVHIPEEVETYLDPVPETAGLNTAVPDQIVDSDEDDGIMKEESDNDSDFTPAGASRHLAPAPSRSSQRSHRPRTSLTHAVQDADARIHKSTPQKLKSKAQRGRKPTLPSNGTHTAKSKYFPCPFAAFGCTSMFPSKNEWKRHTASQHLQLGFFRCDLGSCSPSHPSQLTQTRGYNDFNRKDLFTQHCRRMHWDECDSLQGSKIKGKEWAQWTTKEKQKFEEFMEDVRERCWTKRRGPPEKSACGVCGKVFDDAERDEEGKAWEERMEHVGRHYERGDREPGGTIDAGLQQWCVENGGVAGTRGGWWLKGCEPEESKPRAARRGVRRSLRGEENGTDEQSQTVDEVAVKKDGHEDDTDAEGEDE